MIHALLILLVGLWPQIAAADDAGTWAAKHLPAWASNEMLGLAVWQVLGIFGLILFGLLIRWVIMMLLTLRVRQRGAAKLTRFEQSIGRSALPLSVFITALVWAAGFPFLGFAEAIDLIVVRGLRLIAAVSAIWFIYRQIDVLGEYLAAKAALTTTKLDDQLVPLLRRTLKTFVIAIGGIFILQNLNVDVASLLAGLGLGGLAVALAAKDTLANVFGSLVIFIDRPFQIGDWVIIENVEGMVEDVRFRTTRVRTFYNSLITVPNAKLTQASIDNMGARIYRRMKVIMSLTYSTTPAQMQAFVEGLRAIVRAHPKTRKDYYEIHFNDMGAHSLDVLFYVFFKVPNWSEELETRHELLLSAMKLAQDIGVEFAFPTRTIHVDSFPNQPTRQVGGRPPLSDAQLTERVAAYGPGGAKANLPFSLSEHAYLAKAHLKGGPSSD